MSGHRQAAAALHALGSQDREQILAELPAADQQVLRAYLAELAALGFEGGAIDTVQLAAGDLATAAPAQLYSLLEHEPALLVAQVLALQEWRWRAGLLALFPAARQERIRAVGAQLPPPGPARARYLRAALAARLSAAPRGAASASRWQAWRRWWQSWR